MKEIIQNAWIIRTGGVIKKIPFNGYVVIEHGKITGIHEGVPSPAQIAESDEVTNASGKWLMPGLVNTHGHLGSSLLRGHGDDLKLDTWLKTVMWPNEQKFDSKLVRTAAELAISEMIRSGTTTYLDMYHLSMPELAEMALKRGFRAVLCRGMIAFGSSEEQEAKLQESIDLSKHYHNQGEGRIRVMLSPHAPYTCPPSFYERTAELASEHGLMIHTHASETASETAKHFEEYGMRPVEHLYQLGVLHQDVLLAHAVHLNEAELDFLKETNTAVSHNPMSNLKLGSGIADIPSMQQKGIRIAIGTDSTASNNSLDLFEEMRFAAMIHKGMYQDPTVTKAEEILRMGTSEGANILGYQKTGDIREGFDADLILIDPDQPHLTPWTPERIHSHLIYAVKGSDVTDVWIQGKRQMNKKELLMIDEEKILYESNELVKYFE
ncbi:amidohydrolase [Salisediminibacterium beveridgei]|uniref:5-methylthioadenosine/S-adenosylhomocysteine deaminase n=1 Tax=Salisediminibacterium beveridgei TaxID=632773 RepID=A0A1D7QV51_9BACI|nr:amidohydrolase [Salisediminibacterium beveridgei]AOM82838.1 S-adenosylhomocysteine / Methylthioadenosine deaminase [Salisediminibacterium beveridgei]